MSETTRTERDEVRRSTDENLQRAFEIVPVPVGVTQRIVNDADRLAQIERQVRELADWMDKQADSERVSSDGDEGHRAAEALESYAQELRAIIDPRK